MKNERLKESYNEIFTRAVKRYSSDSSAQCSKAFTAFCELEKVGHVGCLKYLANCYLEGRGCAKNIDKAREYFIASIAFGHYNDPPKPTSYEMIRRIDGEIYWAFDNAEDTFNSNVKEDACIREMYINYVNSIVYGNYKRTAWVRLGDMYNDGIGVEVKKNWAAYFYRRAYLSEKINDEVDCEILYKIGKCFFYGDGVEEDDAMAKWFLERGCDNWDKKEYLDECENLLSAIGLLDESLWTDDSCWADDYGVICEEEYLERISGWWLDMDPDYI